MILRALSVGLLGALMVGILKLVDSSHSEPMSVVLAYMAATAFWFTVIAGVWMALRNYRRRDREDL